MSYLTVSGAYGRVYLDAESVLKDWFAGKDFKIVDGPYCSKADLPNIRDEGYSHIEFVSSIGAVLAIILIGELKRG